MDAEFPVVQFFDPPSSRTPNLLYSHVAEVKHNESTRSIYISGQIGQDSINGLGQTDEEQVSLALENLRRCLQTAGASVRDIVNLTFYVVADFPMQSVSLPLLVRFLEGHRPTSTCVPVQTLTTPGAKFEINAVAVAKDPTKVSLPCTPLTSVVWDVIVVGGGLSGLQAGFGVQKSGLSCLVLEAQNRVGGKTYSVAGGAGKGVVDLGAAFLNDTNQSMVSALATRLRLDLIVQTSKGKSLIQSHEAELQIREAHESEADLDEGVQTFLEQMETLDLDHHDAEQLPYDAMTLEEYARKQDNGDAILSILKILTRAIISQEPSELSALSWLRYCHNAGGLRRLVSSSKDGAQYMRIRQGTQSLAQGILRGMVPGSVLLSKPVASILQDHAGALVETSGGDCFRCRRVIVSVPSTIYGKIKFNPPLPEAKLGYCTGTTMGHNTKALLSYETPWWREHGLSGELRSSRGPITVTLDSSVEQDSQFSLTGFIAGEEARRLAELSRSEQNDAILSQLQESFGAALGFDLPTPNQILVHDWTEDEWIQGAPCPTTPPKILTQYGAAISKPWMNMHFVGTETSTVWTGYMEGALRSGARGAEEVIQTLRM